MEEIGALDLCGSKTFDWTWTLAIYLLLHTFKIQGSPLLNTILFWNILVNVKKNFKHLSFYFLYCGGF